MNAIAFTPLRTARRALALLAAALVCSTAVQAGNVFLTGHDITLHGGQDGYDGVILDYLRNGDGTRATYDVLYITSGGTPAGLASIIGEGFNVTTISHANFALNPTAALAGMDVMMLPWWYDGGAAGNAAMVSASAAIATFFNAGGDIWADSSHIYPQYYNFLPAGVAASGPALAGNPSTGFSPTAAGTAIGITSAMVNGDPTHNVFDSYSSSFTVFETYSTGAVISIGLRNGTISGGDISVPDTASSALMLLVGFAGLVSLRKRLL